MRNERIVLRNKDEAESFRLHVVRRDGYLLRASEHDPSDSSRHFSSGLYWLKGINKRAYRGRDNQRFFMQEVGESTEQVYRRIKKTLLQEQHTARALMEIIKELFPMVRIELEGNDPYALLWRYWHSNSSSAYLAFPQKGTSDLGMGLIDAAIEHHIRQEMAEAYPWLRCGVYNITSDGGSLGFYMTRLHKGIKHAGEGISFGTVYPLTGLAKHKLEKYNAMSREKNEIDGFWCGLCEKVKPMDDYGYYYFTTRACKDCCEANPGWLARAKRETYN